MKNRPDEKLIFELTTALSNRKKEITDFYMYIWGCQSSGIAETLNKSFILLLYAHWEGFIKEYTIKYFHLSFLKNWFYLNLPKIFYGYI